MSLIKYEPQIQGIGLHLFSGGVRWDYYGKKGRDGQIMIIASDVQSKRGKIGEVDNAVPLCGPQRELVRVAALGGHTLLKPGHKRL